MENAIPLFKRYPALAEKLPYAHLGNFPTPFRKLENLGKQIGLDSLYMKDDGLISNYYGGNKVRKLEFLLGESLQKNKQGVITFGFAGSNHAAATAVYASLLGLKCVSILIHQPNANYVRQNLLVGQHYGAEMHLYKNVFFAIAGALRQCLKHEKLMIIPPGGSSALGAIGYVNAAFELLEQIENGMPKPDKIYVALGSMGTTAGLITGIKAAGLEIEVIPVCVVNKIFANEKKLKRLAEKTSSMLHSLDNSFPEIKLDRNSVKLRHEFLGKGYAVFTKEGADAVIAAEKTEGIKLEGTYTGKTLSAIISDAPQLASKNVLFWNTCNSIDLTGIISGEDYRNLERRFHIYFETDVHQLDISQSD